MAQLAASPTVVPNVPSGVEVQGVTVHPLDRKLVELRHQMEELRNIDEKLAQELHHLSNQLGELMASKGEELPADQSDYHRYWQVTKIPVKYLTPSLNRYLCQLGFGSPGPVPRCLPEELDDSSETESENDEEQLQW